MSLDSNSNKSRLCLVYFFPVSLPSDLSLLGYILQKNQIYSGLKVKKEQRAFVNFYNNHLA